MNHPRNTPAPRLVAFTMLELIISISVILVLLGLLGSIFVSLRNQARILSTESRMHAILQGLSQYQLNNGGPALNLAQACGLGGPGPFVSYWELTSSLIQANGPSASLPPDLTIVDYTAAKHAMNTENYILQNRKDWVDWFREISPMVFEVQPPAGASWASSDYLNAWPTQWPETDWFTPGPGTHPPILRFPWGKPGQRIDGSLCDPTQPPGPTTPVTYFTEQTQGAGNYTSQQEANPNSWATYGPPATSTIWNWAPNSSSQTDWVTPISATRSDGTSATFQSNLPLPFDLGYCSPLCTIALLQASGVLPPGQAGIDAYHNDRGLERAWNDAWGNPLVVVYALYIPERYSRTWDDYTRRDLFVRMAKDQYHTNRLVYLAVGAVGNTLDTTDYPDLAPTWNPSIDASVLRDYYLQIRSVCSAASWTENSFTAPPWQNVKVGRSGNFQCLLTAPVALP